jgi:polyisoprenoid-binding protein YceI
MKRTIVALLLMAAGVVPLVDAAELTVVPGDPSSLTFVYQQMGVPVEGRFARFSAQICFDPADPTAAKASLELDLASVDAGSAEADDELASKAWFDTKTHPKATFVSEGVRALGGSHYELSGRMTIKGRTSDITTAFSFTPKGDGGLFDGAFVLKRADFAIGEGVWADFGTVANEVQVKFRFLATPGK